MLRLIAAIVLTLSGLGAVQADVEIPTRDVPNARDHALTKSYQGSLIVSDERQTYTDFKAPLSNLELIDDDSRKIDARRPYAAGVGMVAPAANNDTDEGRAKKRRVEVLKLN
ncbi:MAG TPA: hypothetical protein VNQ50_00295 [Xanthobacteraceae bacterium]|jgi:hypothetical protein|nr:hypothetical protein [Xanthobacteraceae bacterium]